MASVSPGRPYAASPSLASLVAACDPDELVELAISEGLAGPAGAALGQLLMPAQRSRLLERVRLDGARHLAYLGLLKRFGTALDQANVAWVVLKGPVLAELSYGCAPRGYSDLDLMVPPSQLGRAVRALQEVGAVLAEDWGSVVRDAKGEMSMAVSGAPLIDLHWHLVYLPSARERFMIATEELVERRQAVQLRAVEAWALDPEDFTAHVALHASFQGVEQLRRLLDIERTLVNRPPDWDVLVQRCRAWRTGLPVGVMLSRARETLGAVVPDEVLRELAGGQLERLALRRLSAWVPAGYLPGGRSVKSGLTRSLRDNLTATATEFSRETGRTLAKLLTPSYSAPSGPGQGACGPGGPPGFEGYLEMVDNMDRYGHESKRSNPGAGALPVPHLWRTAPSSSSSLLRRPVPASGSKPPMTPTHIPEA